jgi:hypothetical protein
MSDQTSQRLFYLHKVAPNLYSLYSLKTDHRILSGVTLEVASDFLFLNEPTHPALTHEWISKKLNGKSDEDKAYLTFSTQTLPNPDQNDLSIIPSNPFFNPPGLDLCSDLKDYDLLKMDPFYNSIRTYSNHPLEETSMESMLYRFLKEELEADKTKAPPTPKEEAKVISMKDWKTLDVED